MGDKAVTLGMRLHGQSSSLWDMLHDSFLRAVSSDPHTETANITIESEAINRFHGFPLGGRFELKFSGVESLEVLMARRVGAQGRRLESADWSRFESTFADVDGEKGGRYQILDGTAAHAEDQVEFVLSALVDHAGSYGTREDVLSELRIVADDLDIIGPAGDNYSLDAFLALGSAYRRTR
ncbi:MAG: hypothetical protein M3R35_07850 [Candidatus Eremiobacteraeota bacterium]|nr:hypothetical protein [Candidatus Eremiobacteraeota bacterium]